MEWVFMAIGSFIIFMNWKYAVISVASGRRKSYSVFPLIGGVLASVGIYYSGLSHASSLLLIPLIIDLGCIPMLVALIVGLIKKRIRS